MLLNAKYLCFFVCACSLAMGCIIVEMCISALRVPTTVSALCLVREQMAMYKMVKQPGLDGKSLLIYVFLDKHSFAKLHTKLARTNLHQTQSL